MNSDSLSRRRFLRLTALSLGALGTQASHGVEVSGGKGVSLILAAADPLVSAQPVTFAITELNATVSQAGFEFRQFPSLEEAPRSDIYVVAAGKPTPQVSAWLQAAGIRFPTNPESLALVSTSHQGRHLVLACGRDARGLMYALLELADRMRHGHDLEQTLRVEKPISEEPFNEVRSIGRLFVSDVEDKPWFNDREFWQNYFRMLATQRFNRFSLNFGIGFDTLQKVTDSYFLFLYPFLLDVPGYNVRAVNLPDAERDRNLETLQFISRQAVAHGIDFQIGIWTHGYQWADTPHSNYTIEGLSPEHHAAYSRDALSILLKACPDISGVTLRTHGESGVREGSYEFWKTVFEGAAQSGRRVEIDLHPKGLDQQLLDSALATGMPVRLSPKYWAEHMGLPYQQTAIRDLEMPREKAENNFFSLSTGSRIFTRYGYADFLREDRSYSLIYRIWPGTHRFLLWGDPVSAAAHARAFRFCGSNGVELYEPLSFKGRRGSGLAGGRCAYADASLNPARDWEKYLYTYRTWGRLLYNPDSDRDVCRRQLRRDFPSSTPAIETALGAATRIVPLITTAHLPSGANDTYGPEFYTNQPIVKESAKCPYHDTPSPKTFGNVSPLDPEMFARISDFAAEMLSDKRNGKYSPIDVAQWLEHFADVASRYLHEAEQKTQTPTPELRRMTLDVKIQIGLGRFFAAKLRSATLYEIYQTSVERAALDESLKFYRQARDIWASFAQEAHGLYTSDITYGPRADERGHWMDRLAAIDEDVAAMASRLASASETHASTPRVRSAITEAISRSPRPTGRCEHHPPDHFVPKQDLQIVLLLQETQPISGLLHYRHVNQAERYQTVELQEQGNACRATIPASYTDSPYSLQYYFELRRDLATVWL
ncbi:MAG TPA: hypothetical protein VG498_16140, partial [Terriglobales bacterium]|nr:hypothetical protein [Terriglobales bacterium]